MAHWAEIDENNLVIRVLVTSNDEPDEGYQWLIDNLGGRWIKTSYNTVGGVHLNNGVPLRKNFAGIGYIYDETRDAFIPPKPEKIAPKKDYILDETTCTWVFEEAVVEETVVEEAVVEETVAEVVVSQEEIPE